MRISAFVKGFPPGKRNFPRLSPALPPPGRSEAAPPGKRQGPSPRARSFAVPGAASPRSRLPTADLHGLRFTETADFRNDVSCKGIQRELLRHFCRGSGAPSGPPPKNSSPLPAPAGAGGGCRQIWGKNFHFGLANLYIVVYTEEATKDIVVWTGRTEKSGLARGRGKFPRRAAAFRQASPPVRASFSLRNRKERKGRKT